MAMMEERTLELNVMSATHLKKVKTLRHQKSYVVAYIYPDQKHTSKVDEVGGLNPTWNFQLTIKCDEHLLQRHGSYLTLEIYSHGHLSEKLVGTVIVALRDLAKEPRCYGEPPPTLAFEVCRPSGNAKGVLKLSLKIGAVEKRSIEVPADQHPPRDQPPFVCTRLDPLHTSTCLCALCS